ncbi:MAG: hypothetical protein SPJ65_02925 [Roseburia sp.]|nr:hypothetical protein [Roseburia sp.]
MANQIRFEEVESGNSSAAESRNEVIETTEKISEQKSEIHSYLVFSDSISIEDGIKLIRQEVSDGDDLKIEREDTGGNAIVVILKKEQYDQAAKLSEVKSITAMEEAELTTDALPKDTPEESESIEAENSESLTVMTEEAVTEYEMTTESGTESTLDVQNDFTGSNRMTILAITIVVICVIVLIVYMQQKKRW